MNNEIKEIKLWKEKTKGLFHILEYKKFWDYITNLQEENDELKNRLENTVAECNLRLKEIEELKKNQRYYKNGVFSLEYDKETMSDIIDDYKSRIDKALEYINHEIKDMPLNGCKERLNKLLIILQGG